jgi:hypothetical protein
MHADTTLSGSWIQNEPNAKLRTVGALGPSVSADTGTSPPPPPGVSADAATCGAYCCVCFGVAVFRRSVRHTFATWQWRQSRALRNFAATQRNSAAPLENPATALCMQHTKTTYGTYTR